VLLLILDKGFWTGTQAKEVRFPTPPSTEYRQRTDVSISRDSAERCSELSGGTLLTHLWINTASFQETRDPDVRSSCMVVPANKRRELRSISN